MLIQVESAKSMLAVLPLIIVTDRYSSVMFLSVNRFEIVILVQCVCLEKK